MLAREINVLGGRDGGVTLYVLRMHISYYAPGLKGPSGHLVIGSSVGPFVHL